MTRCGEWAQIRPMNRRDVLWALGAGLVVPSLARGWVRPTRSVLRLAQRRMATVAGALKRPVLLSGRAWPGEAALAVQARWAFGPSPQFTVEGADGRTAGWSAAGPSGDAALALDALTRKALSDLFGPGGVTQLVSRLGVDLRRARLGLEGQRVAHVLGARTGDGPERAQVWVDQETFDVLRVQVRSTTGLHELALLDWQGPATQGRFPGRVEVRSQGRWRRALRVTAL